MKFDSQMAILIVTTTEMRRIVPHLQRQNQITRQIISCRRVMIGCSNALTINVFHIGGNVMVSMVRRSFLCLTHEKHLFKPITLTLCFHLDCGDNTDENGCTNNSTISPTVSSIDEPIDTDTCLKNQYMCDNGRCISKSYVCDGFPDCTGGEDESNCPKSACSKDKFRCRSDGYCLDRVKYCDGKKSWTFFGLQKNFQHSIHSLSQSGLQEFHIVLTEVTKKTANIHRNCE